MSTCRPYYIITRSHLPKHHIVVIIPLKLEQPSDINLPYPDSTLIYPLI